MLGINGKDYKLCLLDTNALSSFLQKPKTWINFFEKEFSFDKTVICYSAFTLSELYYRQELFDKYLDFFSVFPPAILDGHESIFNKELEHYDSCEKINPIVIVPSSIQDVKLNPKEKLKLTIEKSSFLYNSDYWKKGQSEVLSSIVALKKNFPPKRDKYSIEDIEYFNMIVSTSQISIRNREFASRIVQSGVTIDLNKFPSLKNTSYFVFYKFYPDKRKPINSDVFDIIISALLPYVDFFITEGNLYDIIRKIKMNHLFLENIEVYKLKDINKIIGKNN